MDTRAQILDAARTRLLSDGLARVSMRRIAADVGISAPALYRHFDSKEALVWAVLEQGFGIFVQYLAQALTAPSPRARFVETGRRYFAFAADHPGYYTLMFGTTMRDHALDSVPDSAKQKSGTAFQMLVDRIRECISDGTFADDDPESVALFVWSQTHGLASLRMAGRCDDLDLPAFAMEVERSLARLVRALSPS